MPGAFQHLVKHQRGRLHDDPRPASNRLGAESDQLPGFFFAQVNVHTGAGAEHKTLHPSIEVSLDQLGKTRVVDLAITLKGRGDRKVDPGKLKFRHRTLHGWMDHFEQQASSAHGLERNGPLQARQHGVAVPVIELADAIFSVLGERPGLISR